MFWGMGGKEMGAGVLLSEDGIWGVEAAAVDGSVGTEFGVLS